MGCVRIFTLHFPPGFPCFNSPKMGLFMSVAKQCSICIIVLSHIWSLKNFSFVQAVTSLVQPPTSSVFLLQALCDRTLRFQLTPELRAESAACKGPVVGGRTHSCRTRGSASRLCCLTLHAYCFSPLQTRGPHLLPHRTDPCRVESSRRSPAPGIRAPALWLEVPR